MLELGRISVTIFSYVTEENDRVVQALRNTLPHELRTESLIKIPSNSQFGDPLVIYSFETDETTEIDAIATYLGNSLTEKSKAYLSRHLSRKLDLENRSVYFRLDKYKAYQDELFITEGSDVIQVEIAYNAYTQAQNTEENVREFLLHYKLISE